MFGRKTVNELFLKFIEDCKDTEEYKNAVKDYEEMCKCYQDEINAGTLQTFHYPVVGIRIKEYAKDGNYAWIYSGCCADSDVWNYFNIRYPKEGLPKGTYYTPEELKQFAEVN